MFLDIVYKLYDSPTNNMINLPISEFEGISTACEIIASFHGLPGDSVTILDFSEAYRD